MNFPSVTGKNWIYKKFDSSVVTDLVEKYSLTELSAKLLSIRKNNMFGRISDHFFLNQRYIYY